MKKNGITKKSHIIWTCVIFLLCNICTIQAQEKYYRVVFDINKEQLKSLYEKGLDVDHYHYKDGKVTAEISATDLKLLKKNNIKCNIKIRNLAKRNPRINKRIDRRNVRKNNKINAAVVPSPSNFSLGSMAGFHTNEEAIAALDKMRQLYPQLITTKSSIGTTVEGRSIYMVKISDNADTDENEDEILFTSIHHAREPIGLSQNIFYMWYLLENYNSNSEIKTLVDNTELYFIPIINPDGYVHNQKTNPNGSGYWRKNRRNNGNGTYGVDLNRNYGYQWAAPGGSSSDSSQDSYHGPSKFSEPETKAMRDFVNKHKFIAALNYHSFSDLLIHPWGYKANTFTPDQSTFVKMCKYMTEENSYTYGTPNQTVNYTAGGNSDDWMYDTTQNSKPKIFAMTPEVGSSNDGGFWPPSSKIIPLCNEVTPFNIKIMRMAAKYAKVTPTNANQTITTTTGNIGYSIKRFSVKQASWKVSLSSNSTYITSIGQPKEYNNITFLESENGSIDFQLKTTTPKGTEIPIIITINNGSWAYTTNVTVTYNGDSTTCTASVPTGGKVTNLTNTTATISWNAIANTKYDLRYRKKGTATWTTLAVDETSKVISGLIASTAYDVQVRSKCADGTISEYSTVISFTTNNSGGTYCDSNGQKTTDEYISKVTLGTISKISTAGTGGYSDFTTESTNLSTGSSNTITITPKWTGTTYNEGYAVWIDYNQDNDFADSGELVWSKAASKTTPVSGSFTVPSGAKSGKTRMRVSMKYNGIPTACESFEYGEVEDYSVVIGGGNGGDTQSPSVPTGVSASNITPTTLTVSWIAATDNVGVTEYDVYRGTTKITSVTRTTANVTGLTANTTYQFSVRAKDAAGNVSDASAILSATTTGSSDPCAGVAPYNGSTTYQPGDRVTYRGRLYEKTNTSWKQIGTCSFFARSASSTDTLVDDNSLFEFYPNPVAGEYVNITVNNNLWKIGSMLIIDVKGNIIQEIKLKNKETQINTSKFPTGTYFLTLFNGSKSYAKQMIIK
ncbi:M14 family zinc carboxypeptidase [Aquimarina longa]|uniref:M14 family zinc carboxypeptidase n=1 Tax=Aquimarina longa TaxID=1080221 RepID=UPI000781D028|nr:M14 family zinc carboxypeptidase [Aquimarina longa]